MSVRMAWWQARAWPLAALVVTSEGYAQAPADAVAAAEALFNTAHRLLDEKKYDEACPKLEESQRLDPAVGTLLYLGLCYERTSREASAWSTYRAAESAAAQLGQAERARIARRRAEQLEPVLARLLIEVSPEAPSSLKITRDGIEIGRAAWGMAIPLDAGRHVVEASAPSVRPFSAYVSIARGQTVTVKIADLLPLQSTPPNGAQTTDTTHHSMASSEGSHRVPSRRAALSPQQWLGLGTSTVGLVGLGIGAGFAVNSATKADDAEKYRRPGTNVYDEPGYALNRQALDSRNAAILSGVVGGLALAGGLVIFLTAPSSRQRGSLPPTRLQATATSLALVGHWQ